jgi:FimV-like protein
VQKVRKNGFLFVLMCLLIVQPNLAAAEVNIYGPTEPGDILWNIAAKVGPSSDGVSRYQVIVALHRANPHAFRVSCNMNSLRIGETLRIPSLTKIQAMTRKQAFQEFKRQEKEWQERSSNPIDGPPVSESALIPPTKATKDEPPAQAPVEPIEQVKPKIAATTAAQPTTLSEPVAQPSPQLVETLPAQPPQEVASTSNNATISSPTSSIMIVLLTLVGLMIALLIAWFLRQHTEKKTLEKELPANYHFSEPFDEMPLTIENRKENVTV